MDQHTSFDSGFRTADLSRRGMLRLAGACCAWSLIKPGVSLANSAKSGQRSIHRAFDDAAAAIEEKMIGWRRDIHQHPELANQETRTAGLVADHLRSLGYEVQEGVAVTGVVAVLKGEAGEGPVVALRADMDALPITEEVDLPFASKVKAVYEGKEVGLMHACGHDCHVAILMAVAEVLAQYRAQLKGTVKLIFQPAEEGLPGGEIAGARLMVEQGVMENPKPDAVFGLHVVSGLGVGQIRYRSGAMTAGGATFRIVVKGKQTHGARPWAGVDPVVVASAIVSALQTLVSRETNIMEHPAVLTIGKIDGGIRANVIPEMVEMTGTLRTYSDESQAMLMTRVGELAEHLAASMNASAETIWEPNYYPSVINDAALVERMAPSLLRVAGEKAQAGERVATSEDFSYFAREVPGMFFAIGITSPGKEREAAPNHSPAFMVDESGLIVGLRSMLHLVADFTSSDLQP